MFKGTLWIIHVHRILNGIVFKTDRGKIIKEINKHIA